jgi:hypothetical protein
MPRRDRHIQIIQSYDDKQVRWAMGAVNARLGHDALTDEAVELLAQQLGRERRIRNRMNAENRRIATAQVA